MQREYHFARIAASLLMSAGVGLVTLVGAAAADQGSPFIPQIIVSSTIPANGDLNPYGVAFVPAGFPAGGLIAAGDVLVSNFNASSNSQGTGTTIVKLTPNGPVAPAVAPGQPGNAITYFTSKLTGLSTALGVLQRGFVIVGNVPTIDGTSNTISTGSLQIIDRFGNLVSTLTDLTFFDSPWDLTINDGGGVAQVFVANVLSGTVSRLDLSVGPSTVTVRRKTMIATGYTHRFDPAALALGPTGLAYNAAADVLYVASTADNTIFSIARAGQATYPVNKGATVFAGPQLRGPLGLTLAPNRDLIAANGDAINGDPTHPSEIVEFTPAGKFVRQFNVDASQGAAFGVAAALSGQGFNFATVGDVANDVTLYALPSGRDEANVP